LEGCTFVAHGVNFDYKFLQQELKPSGIQLHNRRLCTFKLSQKYLPGMPKYGLETLSKELGFEKVKHHRALADARMTAQLLEIILDKWQDNDDF
jgi:DNA polymerase-3 subunit epsilon